MCWFFLYTFWTPYVLTQGGVKPVQEVLCRPLVLTHRYVEQLKNLYTWTPHSFYLHFKGLFNIICEKSKIKLE